MRTCSTTTHLRMKWQKSLQNALNHQNPLESHHLHQSLKLKINVSVPKIKELNQALKGHAKSYGIERQDNLNPLNHFTKTKALYESHLENL